MNQLGRRNVIMRLFYGVLMAAMLFVRLAQAQETKPFCQILDGTEEPAWMAYLDYTGPSRVKVEGGKNVSRWNVGGGGGLYYWRTGVGDVDLAGAYDFYFWDGSGGIDLPDRTVALRLGADYVARYWDGSALLVGIRPGIYSDTEEISIDSFYVPIEALGIQAFNPQISGVIGAAIYPGFDRAFDPRFGVRVAAAESIRVDLMYPETRVIFRPADWEFFGGLRHEAVNEFRLEDDDPRKMIGYRETRAYIGGAWAIGDAVRMQAEVGWNFNREVDFKREASGRDIEDALSVRIGIGGGL
jgi:hypothetical protein